jgi:hypothetical protein
MENKFYVYGLYAPGRVPELFYIGKGSGYRLTVHLGPTLTGQNPYKDRVIKKYQGCYAKKLFENLSEQEAFDLEIKLIAESSGLVNLTDGGDGTSGHRHTEEAKAKMSKSKKGLQAGNKNPMYRRAHTAVSKAKMSEAHTGLVAGENNPHAKLTWATVREIRQRLVNKEAPQSIATSYGITCTQVSRIKTNKNWPIERDPNHVPTDPFKV